MANILQRKKYIIDTKTRNISFIQTAKDLKVLGIKNHLFFLKLYDPSLQGLDPYNPLLPEDTIIRIINECLINPYYFLREVARIPDQGGTGVPFILHRGNLAFIWCTLTGLQSYVIEPRQTYKTQSALAILLWAYLVGTTNSEFMFTNKEQDAANENLDKLKKQRDLLPLYLQFRIAYNDSGKKIEGTDNIKSLTNANNNNKIVTKAKATSKETAEKIGRGCSQPLQFFDEVEFTPHIKTIVQTSGPAYRSASDNARKNNAIYSRLFLSTPGDLDTSPCQDALEIIEGSCKWLEAFYDWTKEDIEEYLAKNATNDIVYIEYQYTQLGFDEGWFIRTCKSLLNDPLQIKREIFLKRIHGSTNSPFEQEDLEMIEDLKGSIKQEIFINKFYKIDIYELIERRKVYIVSVDVGAGTGNDNTAITIIEPYTEKPIAEFKSPYIGLEDTKKFLYVLVRKYIPRAILCIERNSIGAAIIEGLKAMGLNSNLYFDNTKQITGGNVDDKTDESGFLKQQAFNRRLYGVYTGTESRKMMFNLLFTRIRENKDKFIGANIINDMMHLIKDKTGKILAASGHHDDCIMSYLIGMYVLYYGNNLERYGYLKGYVPDDEERNKGLVIDTEEILRELPENIQEMYEYLKHNDEDPSLKYAEEIHKAKMEDDVIDKLTINANAYKLVDSNDEMDEDSIPISFFDDLNK
jgi:hypothetical protein